MLESVATSILFNKYLLWNVWYFLCKVFFCLVGCFVLVFFWSWEITLKYTGTLHCCIFTFIFIVLTYHSLEFCERVWISFVSTSTAKIKKHLIKKIEVLFLISIKVYLWLLPTCYKALNLGCLPFCGDCVHSVFSSGFFCLFFLNQQVYPSS